MAHFGYSGALGHAVCADSLSSIAMRPITTTCIKITGMYALHHLQRVRVLEDTVTGARLSLHGL